jgi:hypothetical protein
MLFYGGIEYGPPLNILDHIFLSEDINYGKTIAVQ